MDEHDDEFELFLKQFRLREPRPWHAAPVVRSKKRWMAWTAAAAAAAAVVFSVFVVLSYRHAQPVVTAGNERVLDDGSRVEMREQSDIAVERAADGIRVRLNKGAVIVNAAPQRGGHLYVETKDCVVSVVGTVFVVEALEGGSRVAVIEGQVQVQHGTESERLPAGKQLATAPGMRPVAIAEQISWSRNAQEHLLLLKQVDLAAVRAALPPQLTPLQSQSQPQTSRRVEFEASSVKPSAPLSRDDLIEAKSRGSLAEISMTQGMLSMRNVSLKLAVAWAYELNANYQVSGGPRWVNETTFDIVSRTAQPASSEEVHRMLQSLLAERFHLAFHRAKQDMPAYTLVAGKNGPKLKASEGQGNPWIRLMVSGKADRIGMFAIVAEHATMSRFAAFLTTMLAGGPDRIVPVIDMTGIAGEFDFTLNLEGWEPSADRSDSTETRKDAVISGIQNQLGLKLESKKVPIEILIIDRADKPGEN